MIKLSSSRCVYSDFCMEVMNIFREANIADSVSLCLVMSKSGIRNFSQDTSWRLSNYLVIIIKYEILHICEGHLQERVTLCPELVLHVHVWISFTIAINTYHKEAYILQLWQLLISK